MKRFSSGDFPLSTQESPADDASGPVVTADTALTPGQRMVSASIGALITSLSVTPFDVIKVRLQAQRKSAVASTAPTPTISPKPNGSRAHYRLHTGLTDVWCRSADLPRANSSMHFSGSVDALFKLVRHEGVFSLWRGLGPTLMMSFPSTVVYFSLYDQLKYGLDKYTSTWSPLLSGTIARTFTTTLVSPIELIRTKAQAQHKTVGTLSLVQSELSKKTGWKSLWRGVAPSLWRDVPFSAVYWTAFETSKRKMSQAKGKDWHVGFIAFLCGASSGVLAATLTHPFDLVKTRRQIEMYALEASQSSSTAASTTKLPSSTSEVLRTIIREEGWLGLMNGLTARTAKIAPACAIMISTYEISKSYWRKHPSSGSEPSNNSHSRLSSSNSNPNSKPKPESSSSKGSGQPSKSH